MGMSNLRSLLSDISPRLQPASYCIIQAMTQCSSNSFGKSWSMIIWQSMLGE